MPECLISEGLILAPFMTRFLRNATKKLLYPDGVAAILPHQFCIATCVPDVPLVLQESTQFEMSSAPQRKGSSADEEWVSADADGPDDAWVDVDKSVPDDIGRGASDVSKGTSTPGQTRIVLQVIKDYYKTESVKVFNWRLENVKN